MKRQNVICFAVNAQTRIIERIYANRKSCQNYADKVDYPMDMYFIHEDSKHFNQAMKLFAGDEYPTEMNF